MTANTGRTVKRWTRFLVDDSAGTLREIPVNSINGVGLEYPEADVTAFQDAVRGVLPDTPDCTIAITGPFDTTAAAAAAASGAAPVLSGSHTVLSAIAGGVTPLTLGIYFGVRHYWEIGEPVFGITSGAGVGFLCTSYIVNPDDGSYSATFKVYPGSTAPAWGTAAVT
jgi:hypothetical protein